MLPEPSSSKTVLALDEPTEVLKRLEDNVASIVRGKREVIRLAIVSLLARGHVLIEDVPGVGKTTLARALAASLGVQFQRIQFTSDLLPSDILGVSVYDQRSESFRFTRGPIFANVVLADEINRATPKTQSALLEAMSENQVSAEGERHRLPEPFIVLATQNPLEHHGTYPLPESQLDRFLMTLQIGYPSASEERNLLLDGGVGDRLYGLEPVLDADRLVRLQRAVPRVKVAEKLADYILAIAHRTRDSERFALGVSTRAVQGLYRAVQALALYEGRDFATPGDVQNVVTDVLAHRLILARPGADSQARRRAMGELVAEIPVPA